MVYILDHQRLLLVTIYATTTTTPTQHSNQLHSSPISYLYHLLFKVHTAIMSGVMDKVKAKVDQVMHKDKTHGKHFLQTAEGLKTTVSYSHFSR